MITPTQFQANLDFLKRFSTQAIKDAMTDCFGMTDDQWSEMEDGQPLTWGELVDTLTSSQQQELVKFLS